MTGAYDQDEKNRSKSSDGILYIHQGFLAFLKFNQTLA